MKLGSIVSEELSSPESNLVFNVKDIKIQINSFIEDGVQVFDNNKEIVVEKCDNLYETPTKIKKTRDLQFSKLNSFVSQEKEKLSSTPG